MSLTITIPTLEYSDTAHGPRIIVVSIACRFCEKRKWAAVENSL